MNSDHHSLQGAGNPHSPAPYSFFTYNLNQLIWFKPIPDKAEQYLREKALKIAEPFKNTKNYEKIVELYTPKLSMDAEGWCRTQLWVFMEMFGASMHCGMSNVVETEVRFERNTEE